MSEKKKTTLKTKKTLWGYGEPANTVHRNAISVKTESRGLKKNILKHIIEYILKW